MALRSSTRRISGILTMALGLAELAYFGYVLVALLAVETANTPPKYEPPLLEFAGLVLMGAATFALGLRLAWKGTRETDRPVRE